jgi:hypothetical protein
MTAASIGAAAYPTAGALGRSLARAGGRDVRGGGRGGPRLERSKGSKTARGADHDHGLRAGQAVSRVKTDPERSLELGCWWDVLAWPHCVASSGHSSGHESEVWSLGYRGRRSGPGGVAMGQGMTARERIRSFVTETFFVDDFGR